MIDPVVSPRRSPRAPNRSRLAPVASWAHGWTRATERPDGSAFEGGLRRGVAPGGISLLLGIVVVAIAAAGIVRVHASARVLGLGAEITELTDEQSRLQEQKRRLLAERAYLRHPDQIGDAARSRFGMVAVVPDLVQPIRLVDAPPSP
ncbi:MAG: septum formation initiator family protein [Myxococcales bacterium]|nr:septum formation initiator family protein [Myxococcales bacterium]